MTKDLIRNYIVKLEEFTGESHSDLKKCVDDAQSAADLAPTLNIICRKFCVTLMKKGLLLGS